MRNIVILLVDCLRRDVFLERKGFENMRFIKEYGLIFRNFFANAPSTHYAVPAILTGLYLNPRRIWGIHGNVPYLPLIMKEKGFSTVFITSNVVTSRAYGYDRGVDYFEDFMNWNDDRRKNIEMRKMQTEYAMGIIDKDEFKKITAKFKDLASDKDNYFIEGKIFARDILDEFLKALKVLKKPVFAFLHFMEPHMPYYAPESIACKYLKNCEMLKNVHALESIFKVLYRNRYLPPFNEETLEDIKSLYIASVEWFDETLGELLDLIDSVLGLDKTSLIIMADHGEGLGDHIYYGHPMDRHHSEQIRIPFAIYAGNFEKGVNDGLFQEIDVVPTVLELIGESKTSKFMGKSMLSGEDNEYVLAVGENGTASLTTKKYRFLIQDGDILAYNFSDYKEQNPLDLSLQDKNFVYQNVKSIFEYEMKRNLKFFAKWQQEGV